jgi:simple sugar transport system substrate-binding protein
MKRNRIVALLTVVVMLGLLGLFVAACGEEEQPAGGEETSAAPEAKITKIGIVAPEEAKDFGWNQQGVQSAENLGKSLGVPVDVADGAGYGDVAPILRELVQQDGCDFLIAFASGYNTVAPNVAKETETPTIVIGAMEAGNTPGLVQDIETYAQDGAYLAGILAARMTQSGTVGIVISADDENWTKMAAGFGVGAKTTKPDVKILFAQVGQAAYADAAAAKRTTEQVIAGGADIVFGMGDGSSFGMIQAVENATPPEGADKVWFIDVIGDKSSLDKKGVLLSSEVWDYTPAFEEAAKRLEEGTFGDEIIYIDLQNNGIGLMKTEYIPDDVWTEIETAKQGIIDGSITVPEITSKAEVEKLIKQ